MTGLKYGHISLYKSYRKKLNGRRNFILIDHVAKDEIINNNRISHTTQNDDFKISKENKSHNLTQVQMCFSIIY